MLRETTISFIGSGNMAEAMVKGMLDNNLIAPERILAAGPRSERGDRLRDLYAVSVTTDNREAAAFGRIVVLSVKPQVLHKVIQEIRPAVQSGALVLSIIAGTRIHALLHGLSVRALVRAMPNTPAQIGKGMTVWTATPEVDETRRAQAQAILGSLGEELFVEEESYLDMATALSGTGPAYVFLFMEALIDAGVHMGFSRRVAQQLVLQTMDGAVAMAKQTGGHPTMLRNNVTSPGGTSAEAIYELEKGSLRTVVSKAVWAAYNKSKYLGDLSEE